MAAPNEEDLQAVASAKVPKLESLSVWLGGQAYTDGASAPSLYTSGSSLKLYFGGLQEQSGTFFNIVPADINEIK